MLRTVNAFPVFLLLAIEDRIFIFRQHLLFPRHFLVPSLQVLRRHPFPAEGAIEGRDDVVDKAKAFALPALLHGGESPRYFPAHQGLVVESFGGAETGIP